MAGRDFLKYLKLKGEVIKNKRISDFCISSHAALAFNNPVFFLFKKSETLDISWYFLEDLRGLEAKQPHALSYRIWESISPRPIGVSFLSFFFLKGD